MVARSGSQMQMSGQQTGAGRTHGNALVVVGLLPILTCMSTLVYYTVPLYRLFCQVTGYGGTIQFASSAPEVVSLQTLVIRFDTNTAQDLPCQFSPPDPIRLHAGEERLVTFTAVNLGREPILGTATFNVTPPKAGKYFRKVECFCFTEQLLLPGERKDFPVTYFVDPAIAEDPGTQDVHTITLSYTLFNKGRLARDDYMRTHRAKWHTPVVGKL